PRARICSSKWPRCGRQMNSVSAPRSRKASASVRQRMTCPVPIWTEASVRNRTFICLRSGAFHQEPCDVVLRKFGIAAIRESIIDEPHLLVTVEDLACKIALEKAIGMAAVGNCDRCRVVILRYQKIAGATLHENVVDCRKRVGVDVDQYA